MIYDKLAGGSSTTLENAAFPALGNSPAAAPRRRMITFHSDAYPGDPFVAVSFRGEEAISRPYEFSIDLACEHDHIEFDELLKQTAHLGIRQPVRLSDGRGYRVLRIHGVLASVELTGTTNDWFLYRVTLVPRLSRLAYNVQSRIFLDKTVPQIVKEVLKDADVEVEDSGLHDHEYLKNEYVVQYQESDLNFVSRLLEREGIFYTFSQRELHEALILGDCAGSYDSIIGTNTIPFSSDELSTGDGSFDESIQTMNFRQDLAPSQVVMNDYNWRQPTRNLKAKSKITPEGIGRRYLYGEHYKSKEEGEVYARIRAEEIQCRTKVYPGSGNVRSFRAGTTFQLKDHPAGKRMNREFVITEIRHGGSQAVEHLDMGFSPQPYVNEFECIQANIVFRPRQVAPLPRVSGFLHAKVDGAGNGDFAETDELGRYKVKLPFDLSGRKDGKASRFIRMAQPYAGVGYGMHFPLHKGTEVLLTHMNGDPDRPIIASAVPNPETPEPLSGDDGFQLA